MIDCKPGEKKDESKSSPSKYVGPEQQERAVVAPVLKIAAKVDGKSAVVGLDTYAGAGMVLEELVLERTAEWRPTQVALRGTARILALT
jgi:hypothetical protein